MGAIWNRGREQSVKPQKMKAYGSFEEWKYDQSEDNQKLITALSRLVEQTAPSFTPSVKWGQGCWLMDGTPRVYIHAEPDHVQLGFYAGSSLDDPLGLLAGKGKYVRHVKVSGEEDVRSDALTHLLRQVI